MLTFTLYTRVGCHLCEDMEVEMARRAIESGFTLELVDIDESDVLRQKYNEWVPALFLGEAEVCHHFLDPATLNQVIAENSKC